MGDDEDAADPRSEPDLMVSELSEVPVKYELRSDDLERLKNHLQGSHQEALASVIAHAAQIKSPGFKVPSSSTRLSEMMTTVTPLVNADGSEAGQKGPIGAQSVNVATDSYTWRKYGMKQVKSPEGGSRSYYKCTYSACDAKKIESCDRYNFTVKIVYKSQHKHDPPKRVASKGGVALKRKLMSTPPTQVEQIGDSEIEQRLVKNSSSYGNPGLALKNPKFVVHAAAHMEISADGYRWKKYGQKMVKGTPHPRNYYKCTSAGCTVRKHIEKVVDGSSQVTITYKGVHDHDMPVPKKGQGPPTALTIKNIIQYKRREHLPTNETARTNESAQTEPFCVSGLKSNIVENPHLGKL